MRKNPVLTEYRAGWTPEPAWTFRRNENALASAGIRTPDRSARSLVTILTELTRLLLRICSGSQTTPASKVTHSWMIRVHSRHTVEGRTFLDDLVKTGFSDGGPPETHPSISWTVQIAINDRPPYSNAKPHRAIFIALPDLARMDEGAPPCLYCHPR